MSETIKMPARDTEHERVLGIVFNISPAQASVLSCLARGTVISSDELLKFTGGRSQIKVVVSRTRAKLQELGMDIQSKMGVGYWLESDDKAKIEGKVTEFLEG